MATKFSILVSYTGEPSEKNSNKSVNNRGIFGKLNHCTSYANFKFVKWHIHYVRERTTSIQKYMNIVNNNTV